MLSNLEIIGVKEIPRIAKFDSAYDRVQFWLSLAFSSSNYFHIGPYWSTRWMSHRTPKVWILHYSFHSRASPYLNLIFFLLLSTKFVNKVLCISFVSTFCQKVVSNTTCLQLWHLKSFISFISSMGHRLSGEPFQSLKALVFTSNLSWRIASGGGWKGDEKWGF